MSSKKNRNRNGGQRRSHPHTTPARPTAAATASGDTVSAAPAVVDLSAAASVSAMDLTRAEATSTPVTMTVHGIRVTLDPREIASWEFVELASRADSGDLGALVEVVNTLLGESRDEVLAALRDPETGHVPLDAVVSAIGKLMKAAGLGN